MDRRDALLKTLRVFQDTYQSFISSTFTLDIWLGVLGSKVSADDIIAATKELIRTKSTGFPTPAALLDAHSNLKSQEERPLELIPTIQEIDASLPASALSISDMLHGLRKKKYGTQTVDWTTPVLDSWNEGDWREGMGMSRMRR